MEAWASDHGARLVGFGPGWGKCVEVDLAAGAEEEACASQVRQIDGIEAVLTASRPTHHVAGAGREPQRIEVGPARFGGGFASAIAGPCSVEEHDSLLALAWQLRRAGATALRGGAFKPRTSPYSFQGLGRPGLEILRSVSDQTGLPVVTEVLDPRAVELVAEFADVLQIGSRNMMNYALLSEAGGAGRPVLLKRGMSATLGEFLLAAEYLAHAGCSRILLCERGLRHFDPTVRNLLDLAAVPALKRVTHLPVVVDPSHGTGSAALVPAMLAAAAAAGADGFLVEVHPDPRHSVSDASQALSPEVFATALERASKVLEACDRRLARPAAETQPV
ncbi:MAG: 3-deoxy-7-phosphoheptulonate synthase [Planctomycetes bacterium]|nr:3-deoxy-7-phosphoheptulonate synthase [Planctomycetota bacterium]MBL7009198.1 3-deoxy-7-phosphoheptulonate synthase [Planctomycetota bacterium]